MEEKGLIESTGPRMRRFFFSVDEASDLVIRALNNQDQCLGGILSKKMKSAQISDILDVCQPDGPNGPTTGWCLAGEEFDTNDAVYCESNAVDCTGVCDGEYVLDAGEAFSDDNENGIWDAGEEMIGEAACCTPGDLDENGLCPDLSLAEFMIPDEFSLDNIYPNPFNPRANIVYSLPEYTHVKVTVYDIRGRTMDVLINGFETAGYYTIKWDASAFASGVYFIEMRSDCFREVRKVLHMK